MALATFPPDSAHPHPLLRTDFLEQGGPLVRPSVEILDGPFPVKKAQSFSLKTESEGAALFPKLTVRPR